MISQDENFSQASLEYGTYLTVKWGVEVKKNEVINYGRKSCHTRKGVDLQKNKSSLQPPRSQGYHYRPRSSIGSGDVLG